MTRTKNDPSRLGLRFRHEPAIEALASLSCAGGRNLRRFREHVMRCARCRREAAGWGEALESLAGLCPSVAPPKGLKAALLNRVRRGRIALPSAAREAGAT